MWTDTYLILNLILQFSLLLDTVKPKAAEVDTNDSLIELNEDAEIDEHQFLDSINVVTVPQSHIDEMLSKVLHLLLCISS